MRDDVNHNTHNTDEYEVEVRESRASRRGAGLPLLAIILAVSVLAALPSCRGHHPEHPQEVALDLQEQGLHEVTSPFGAHMVDVSGFHSGDLAIDPQTGGVFLVPENGIRAAVAASEADIAAFRPPSGFKKDYSKARRRYAQAAARNPSAELTYAGTQPSARVSRRAASFVSGRYYDFNYRPSVGCHFVRGHFRSDGTFVAGHYKTAADDSFWNNWSSAGNVNAVTGRVGTKLPSSRSHTPSGGRTWVNGYRRKNGTYVRGHYRRR